MTDKATAIAQLESGFQEFRAKFADLPEEAYSEVWLGTWSLDHVLTHMAGWYREMAPAFDRVGRGERPAPEGVNYNDVDAWNEKFAANVKHGKAALTDFDDAYQVYLAAAKRLPDEKYGIDGDRPRIGNRLLQGAGVGHFEEHGPQIDDWLKSRK